MNKLTYGSNFSKRSNPISWSNLYAARRDVARRFGIIWKLPLRKRWRDVLRDLTDNQMSVLEVGAGDRRVGDLLHQWYPDLAYESMDVDRHLPQDYYRLEDVERSFDVVFAFEVIEHTTLDDARRLLRQMHAVLRPDGRLLLTTPNTYYPPDFLRDATHLTPFCYDELGAVVTLEGFHVEQIVRIYNAPLHRLVAHRWLFSWLHRFVGIDFARQIMLVARKVAVDSDDESEAAVEEV